MAYSKQTWNDGPDGGTPINAARLTHIEDGIAGKQDVATLGATVAADPTVRAAYRTALSLSAFGGASDGTMDNSVALAAAVAALPASGGRIFIPEGRDWHFATKVTITKPVQIFGAGGGKGEESATRLVFASGQGGLAVNVAGLFSLRDLALWSQSSAAGAGQHGLHITNGRAELANVAINGFGGHGVFFDSTGGGNVNHSLGINVRAYGNRGDGIRIEGGTDSNRITLIAPDVVANYGWGINNMGNTNIFIGPHADQQYNGSPGAFRDNGLSALWQAVYAEAAGAFLIDSDSRSGTFNDSLFGAATITVNGAGYTTWEIIRDRGVRTEVHMKGLGAGDHEYKWATSLSGTGTLDLYDQTANKTSFTVLSDGSVRLPNPVGFNGVAPVGKAASPGTATGTDAAVINAVVTALRNIGIVT